MNIENYNKTFPKWPPLVETNRWKYGVWLLGNNYKSKNKYYGEYPPTYLNRVYSLFPDAENVLHIFSGMVEYGHWKNEITIDLNESLKPKIVGNCQNLPFKENSFDLILADPPYSSADAVKYNCKMPNRKAVIHECYKILKPNGYLVWLDTTYPMYTKKEFNLIGTIGIIRSTNHRTRTVFVWEKI